MIHSCDRQLLMTNRYFIPKTKIGFHSLCKISIIQHIRYVIRTI